MPRPGITFAAAAAGVLALGVAVKHFRGSDAVSTDPVEAERAAASSAENHNGWVAHAEPGLAGGSQVDRPSTGMGSVPKRLMPHHGIAADDDTAGNTAAGGPVVMGNAGTARQQLAAGARGSDPIHANPALAGAAMPEAARGLAPGAAPRPEAGTGATQQVAAAAGDKPADKPGAENTDPALLLSLPFTKSSDPVKGEVPIADQNVQFDDNGGAQFSPKSQFAVPNPGISGDAGTISFWMRPDDLAANGQDSSLVQFRDQHAYDNRLQISMNPDHLGFMLADNAGNEAGTGTAIQWEPTQWYQVTATWENGVSHLYLNGQQVSQNTYAGQFAPNPGTPLYIGSNYPGDAPGPQSTFQNFQVYGRAQTPDEIAQAAANAPK